MIIIDAEETSLTIPLILGYSLLSDRYRSASISSRILQSKNSFFIVDSKWPQSLLRTYFTHLKPALFISQCPEKVHCRGACSIDQKRWSLDEDVRRDLCRDETIITGSIGSIAGVLLDAEWRALWRDCLCRCFFRVYRCSQVDLCVACLSSAQSPSTEVSWPHQMNSLFNQDYFQIHLRCGSDGLSPTVDTVDIRSLPGGYLLSPSLWRMSLYCLEESPTRLGPLLVDLLSRSMYYRSSQSRLCIFRIRF